MTTNPPKSKSKVQYTGDFLLGLLLTAFALFVIIEAWRMPQRGNMGFLMSPGFVPFLTGIALLCLCMGLTAGAVVKGGMKQSRLWLRLCLTDKENRRFLIICAFTGLYVVGLLGRVPFSLATLVFHALIFYYLRVGSIKKIALYALLATIFVAYVLPGLFEMPLP